jgi:carbonic anhydrase/acetyltransferase-like protein (isoleucine patch superfamily)
MVGSLLRFGRNAALVGHVSLGADAWIGDGCVIRGDGNYVRAGRELMLGPRSTVHIQHSFPTLIGNRVTVGDFGVVHACTIGDDCVLRAGAIVLDGSVVESGVVLAEDSIVYPRTTLAGGFVYAGRPAKRVRRLEAGEIGDLRDRLRERIRSTSLVAAESTAQRFDASVFIANTATMRGNITMAEQAQIWYGCDIDATKYSIVVGARSNVQDNSVLSAQCGPISIGANSTIGHNVRMDACTIGDRTLVGIGAVLAPGTVIGDDVFVAAGAVTTPDQELASGFWVGSPARRIADLDEGKRQIIAATIPAYLAYAAELGRVQATRAT